MSVPVDQMQPGQAPMEDEEMDAPAAGETEVFETMVAGLREHIFGGAEQSIREKLRNTDDVYGDIGNMALALVMEAAKQATQSGAPIDIDFDMLMSVGSEIIDDLLEIADAMGVLDGVDDDDRSKAMLSAIRAYLMSADVPPEEQELAKQQLQQMQVEGDVDEATGQLAALGEREGVDPFADEEQPPAQPQRPSLMGA